jgi:recombination protein RecA
MKGKKKIKYVGKKDSKGKDGDKKEGTLKSVLSNIKNEFKNTNPDIISDPKKIVQFVSSGNFVCDLVCNGGWPRRRIAEVFGMEHSGKSSLLYASFAYLQKKKGLGILFDYEGSWEPQYAKRTFGLVEDEKTFVVFQPDTVEEGDLVFEKLQQLPKIDLFVVDSVDAMKPRALIECSLSKEAKIGAHAKAVGQVIAKFRRFGRTKNCAIVLTNQVRSKINIKGVQNTGTGSGFNVMEPLTTPGGWSVRFYASLRIKTEFGGQLKDEFGINPISGEHEEIRIGNQIKIINVKNKVGPPMLKYLTHYDFPTKLEPGGWNEAKDIMYILQKRGRLVQVRGKLTYVGLKEQWSYSGSKLECRESFLSTKGLIEDGKKLIHHLMKVGGDLDVLEKVNSEDIEPEDLAYQDELHPDVKVENNDDSEDSEIQGEEIIPVKNVSL